MPFFTTVPLPSAVHPIDHRSKVVLLGSCFAENMAGKFDYFQFQNTVNPFGILFSPDAIEKVLSFAAESKRFTEADLFFHNERWHCFDAHSGLSGKKDEVLTSLNEATTRLRGAIADATHINITLGTAWVYRRKDNGALVANCHKVPQKEFTKELRSPNEVAASLEAILAHIRRLNLNTEVIFTVSPVRHLKDGFVENQRSKAHLIAGLHTALEGESGVSYFPSYEIMMDELRDYRFCAADMLHPNETAIDYIWSRFATAWIAPEARPVMDEVEAVRKGLGHRPFDPDGDAHQRFLLQLQTRIAVLRERFPHMDFGG